MKGQQLLALCLLACIAGVALAARQNKDKDTDYNYESDYMKKNYGEYGYDEDKPSKDDYEHDYGKKPECGPTQFKELAEPTCIDPKSGEAVHIKHDDEDACTIDKQAWCKKVPYTKWGCMYSYKKAGTQCNDADGVCDLADVCDGKSAVCKDLVRGTDFPCYKSDSPCRKNAYCDGKKTTCPTPKNAPNGTPCKDDGLYSEAYGEDGKVAMQATVSSDVAKKHGWATCQRCFEGKCAAFKFEWWNKKTSKKHAKRGKKHSGNKHNDEHDDEYDGDHKKNKYDDNKNKYDDDKKKYDDKKEKYDDDKKEKYDDKKEKYNDDKKEKYNDDKKEKYNDDKKEKYDDDKKEKYNDDKEKEYESDYDEYDGEEWYDSKVDYEQYAKLEGYEPEVYCKKMHVKTDDKTY